MRISVVDVGIKEREKRCGEVETEAGGDGGRQDHFTICGCGILLHTTFTTHTNLRLDALV